MNRAGVFGVMIVLVLGVGLGGCVGGYELGPVHSEDIETVAVPIFENRSFEPGPERLLSEAVAKAISRETPWGISSSTAADATIRGVITDIEYGRLGRLSGTGLPDESIVRIRVDFDFVDSRTGESLVSRRSFEVTSAFVPDLAVGERIDVGRYQAYDELAEAIVRELRGAW